MKLKHFLGVLIAFLSTNGYANSDSERGETDLTCDGNWVNPITDVCWNCLFPMSIGNTQVSSS
ncbi:TraU family protein, partial [Glaesserella parasuis]|nr:TraU family protein [Glaesserella parasuis]